MPDMTLPRNLIQRMWGRGPNLDREPAQYMGYDIVRHDVRRLRRHSSIWEVTVQHIINQRRNELFPSLHHTYIKH